ncbi:MAG: DUF721 domain-containing protein [Leucobacter sp.]|nr:DUF721 domain-containing protein [Leucobacter sp.]
MTSPDKRFASEAYLRIKALFQGRAMRSRRHTRELKPGSTPFSKGRDPQSLGSVLEVAAYDMGWTSDIEQAQLIIDWPKIIGENTASHTKVVELRNGVLIVQCDSTAWATELRRIRAHVLTRISEEYPAAEIEDLRFLAPGAPSWRHGARVARGRGPRDTYG